MTDPDSAGANGRDRSIPEFESSVSRRRLLGVTGAAVSAALAAGCLSNPWAPGGATTDDGGDERGVDAEGGGDGGGSGGDGTTSRDGGGDPSGAGTVDGAGDGTDPVGSGGDSTTSDAGTADGSTATAAGDADTTTAETSTVPPEGQDPDQIVEVAPDGFRYAPETFEIAVGDTVHWRWKDDGHNVRVDEKPDGSSFTGTPGSDSDTYGEGYLYAHTFEVAGDYEVYCAPHRSLGLRGSFTVR